LVVSFIVPTPGALSGGAVVLERQCRHLMRDHTATLLTFPPATDAEHQSLATLRCDGVEVVVVGRTYPPWLVALKRTLQTAAGRYSGRGVGDTFSRASSAMQSAIDRELARGRHDLLHVESFGLAGYRWPATLPVVVIEHEVLAPSDARRRRAAMQRTCWKQADLVQVFTQRDANQLRELEPDLRAVVRVNPFGVSLPELTASAETDDRSLVFVGSLAHPPNREAATWLIDELMLLLRKRQAGVRLTIVGDAPPRSLRLKAATDIEVTGRVPSVGPYLRRAAVVVAPVWSGGGLRVKILEAMAHAKAVVTTSLGAEGVSDEDGPRPLEVADDVDVFADRVVELLTEPRRRAALGRRARSYVERHRSWMAYEDRLSGHYREAGDRHRARQRHGAA